MPDKRGTDNQGSTVLYILACDNYFITEDTEMC